MAVSERRIVVTEDRDFSDLVYRDGVVPPPAILYLRCGPDVQSSMIETLLLVLANTDIEGHMVVVRRNTIRLRPLPSESNDNG